MPESRTCRILRNRAGDAFQLLGGLTVRQQSLKLSDALHPGFQRGKAEYQQNGLASCTEDYTRLPIVPVRKWLLCLTVYCPKRKCSK
jgi:hypothetical protein